MVKKLSNNLSKKTLPQTPLTLQEQIPMKTEKAHEKVQHCPMVKNIYIPPIPTRGIQIKKTIPLFRAFQIENEAATKFMALCVLSNYVQNNEDKSVSGTLISTWETDKTRTLNRFFNVKGILVETDLTYIGIVSHVLPKIENGEIKTLIIPDMVKTIMKKQATMHNFIGILNNLIEEGVYGITLRDTRDFHGARANLLTSMTPSLLYQNKLMWNNMGFLSRFLPFTYSYTEQKKNAIQEAIAKGNVLEPKPIDLKLPVFPAQVRLPKKIALKTIPLVKRLTETERAKYTDKDGNECLTKEGYGFRHQHQLQTLLRANALFRGDTKVTVKDYREIERLSRWINYDFNYL